MNAQKEAINRGMKILEVAQQTIPEPDKRMLNYLINCVKSQQTGLTVKLNPRHYAKANGMKFSDDTMNKIIKVIMHTAGDSFFNKQPDGGYSLTHLLTSVEARPMPDGSLNFNVTFNQLLKAYLMNE